MFDTNWNIAFWEYDFLAPHWFWLLVLIPVFYLWMNFLDRQRSGELKFTGTDVEQAQFNAPSIRYIRWAFQWSYALVAVLFIVALAKPVHPLAPSDTDYDYRQGIDILIAMDISVSMMARDFEPNRLEASKKVAKEFIASRKTDRIGLVAYAGEAFTACPTTLDHSILNQQIESLQVGLLDGNTAIGTGLGTAVTRLRNDTLPSKVIILLTDGVNTAGKISPIEAAELAVKKNIRVYTIGVGTEGMAPSPMITPFGIRYQNQPVEIDEQTLKNIAKITGGTYYRATDESSLRKIYKDIDRLEKRRIKQLNFNVELPSNPAPFIQVALLLLFVIWFIQTMYYKSNA
jgi:Ca-activated chloride channel family protein